MEVQPVGHSAVLSVAPSRSHVSRWSPSVPVQVAATVVAMPVQVPGITSADPAHVSAHGFMSVSMQPGRHAAVPSVAGCRSHVRATSATKVQATATSVALQPVPTVAATYVHPAGQSLAASAPAAV